MIMYCPSGWRLENEIEGIGRVCPEQTSGVDFGTWVRVVAAMVGGRGGRDGPAGAGLHTWLWVVERVGQRGRRSVETGV